LFSLKRKLTTSMFHTGDKHMGVDSFRRETGMSVEPLPDDVVVRLQSDPTAAVAAALIVAGAFPDIASWAARTICVSSNLARKGDSGANSERGGGTDQSNGEGDRGGQSGGGGGDETGRLDGANDKLGDSSGKRRRHTEAEEQLLALMRANPGATVGRLAELTGRSRSAIVQRLTRLEKAGLVEHGGHGSWTVADVDLGDAAPPSTTAPWVTPLSGRHVARFDAVHGRADQAN
jgi:hypothetical protein